MSGALDLLNPSNGVYLVDHFLTNDAVADASLGELRWERVTIGNASTVAYKTQEATGVVRQTTAATANGDGEAWRLFEDGIILRPGFRFGARLRRPVELASLNFRVGLDDSVTATRPTVGVTLESDAGVLSCCTDSADHGDNSVAVTKHPDLTSGTTEVVGDWLEFDVVGSGKANAQGGPASVDFFIGSGTGPRVHKYHVATVPCNIDDDEEVEPKIAVWQDAGSADAVIIDFDYYYLWLPRT